MCGARSQCERCRSIVRELRTAGHAVTPSSRYDALRMVTVGAYGFDACILPVPQDEPSIIDAAVALLSRTKVGLVIDPVLIGGRSLPVMFRVIDAARIGREPFPVDWIEAPVPLAPDPHPTRQLEIHRPALTDVQTAQRRLKTIARRAQRELGAAGFAGEPRLDLLAALEDEIAWAAASGTTFGIVLVHVAHRASTAPTQIEKLLGHFATHVKNIVRSLDAIAQGSDSLMVVIADATPEGTSLVGARIKKAVRGAQKEVARDKSFAGLFDNITVGTATYPMHGTTRAALLARATASAAALSRT